MRSICISSVAVIALMAGGCQQAKPVVKEEKPLNLLGDLQMRSATTSVYTATTQASDGGIIVNTLGMRMVPIAPATFTMGSTMNEAGRQEDEHRHEVRITKPYHIATTEVTQSQWVKVMRTQPWYGKKSIATGKDQPATHMTHAEAVQFCLLLSRLENATYRLPTEAEWELACRGGLDGAYGIEGSHIDFAWTDANTMGDTAATVARKKPNALGMYDMHGNVAEWCSDWYGPYPRAAVVDPTGPGAGEYRIVRGGAWDAAPRFCRSAYRAGTDAQTSSATIGLRVVLVK